MFVSSEFWFSAVVETLPLLVWDFQNNLWDGVWGCLSKRPLWCSEASNGKRQVEHDSTKKEKLNHENKICHTRVARVLTALTSRPWNVLNNLRPETFLNSAFTTGTCAAFTCCALAVEPMCWGECWSENCSCLWYNGLVLAKVIVWHVWEKESYLSSFSYLNCTVRC